MSTQLLLSLYYSVAIQSYIQIDGEQSRDHSARYSMSNRALGRFLIFNQDKFSPNHPWGDLGPTGSSSDAKRLEKTMGRLPFSVARLDNWHKFYYILGLQSRLAQTLDFSRF